MNPTGLDIELCTGCEAPYFLGRGSKFPSGRARKQGNQAHARKKQMQGMTYVEIKDVPLYCCVWWLDAIKVGFRNAKKNIKKHQGRIATISTRNAEA